MRGWRGRNRVHDLPVAERFFEKVDKDGAGGCWLWRGTILKDGYGAFKLDHRTVRAHRMAWYLTHGEWPELLVLHRCDVRACVRPEHLFLGTARDNLQDASRKGRLGRKYT